MDRGIVQVLCGTGAGKSACAIGLAIKAAGRDKDIVVIQFLKGKAEVNAMSRRLEPEIRVFSFEKTEQPFLSLEGREREEEAENMRNGLDFARKVLSTGNCDVLVLDEVLGLIDCGIITVDELAHVLEARDESVDVIMTGINFPKGLARFVDKASRFDNLDLSEI